MAEVASQTIEICTDCWVNHRIIYMIRSRTKGAMVLLWELVQGAFISSISCNCFYSCNFLSVAMCRLQY